MFRQFVIFEARTGEKFCDCAQACVDMRKTLSYDIFLSFNGGCFRVTKGTTADSLRREYHQYLHTIDLWSKEKNDIKSDEWIVEQAREAGKRTQFGELVYSKLSKGVNSAYGIGFIEGMVAYRDSISEKD